MKSDKKGSIFNIERYAVHDGPGIRTIVFLKGCPLRCSWCQNPEGQLVQPELALFEKMCIDCGRCLEACPTGAVAMRDEALQMDWSLCTGCLRCAEVCPGGARQAMGRCVSTDEVLEEAMKDRAFYRRSNGGITLSGGDPVMQIDFSSRLLKTCRDRGLHTVIETCGLAPWGELARLLEFTDLVLFDIKHMDCEKHRRDTGSGNREILENAGRAAEAGTELIVRVPVVPGFNDSPENILETARFVRDLKTVKRIELLPYHTMGVLKYSRMGKEYKLPSLESLDEDSIQPLKSLILEQGLECEVV